MPIAVLALTVGAFGIGTAEFIIAGLLLQVAVDLHVTVAAAGLLTTGYALGVAVGAPLLTLLTLRWPSRLVLVGLMAIFTLGNIGCAAAPDYPTLMAARIVTAMAHGTFFGVGSVVATGLVPPQRRASAIALMFTGLTAASLLGVPAGAWLGLAEGWRTTFWAMAVIGIVAMAVLMIFIPARPTSGEATSSMIEELSVLRRAPVLISLAVTTLGFSGMMAVFTFIQPMLTQLASFHEGTVSAVLLLFGGGLVIGNVLGGRFADRWLTATLIGSLAALTLVVGGMGMAMHGRLAAAIFIFLLGVTSFATVAPLQLAVLKQAGAAGQRLASSLNIAAFNLANALGASLGALMIGLGDPLSAIPVVASGVTLLGLALAVGGGILQRRKVAHPEVSLPLLTR